MLGDNKMLWFGLTVVERRAVVAQEVHGPFEDTDALTDAVDERVAEVEDDGFVAVPFLFELCTDDVPEIVDYEPA